MTGVFVKFNNRKPVYQVFNNLSTRTGETCKKTHRTNKLLIWELNPTIKTGFAFTMFIDFNSASLKTTRTFQ